MVRKERHVINHLIQLQDLVAARAQQQASMPARRFEQLDKNIKALANELQPDLRSHFNRLLQKNIEAIVPINGGNCSGCGYALTKTMVNSVHAGEELNRCPNCTRLLYAPDVPLKRQVPKRSLGEAVKCGVERFSAPELMIPSLQGTTRDEVLQEISRMLESEKYVESGAALADAALRREAIVPTAVDHGIAFPHVRGVEGGGLTLALGISKKGVNFGASANRLSRIFFFMVIPTAASAFYLKLLSGLTQSVSGKETRELLLKAKTQEALWAVLVKSTRKLIR